MPLEVHVQHGDFDRIPIGGFDESRHSLRCPHGIDGKSPADEVGLRGRFSVRFQNVNGGERVLVPLFLPGCRLSDGRHVASSRSHGFVTGNVRQGGVHLYALDRVDRQFGEEIHFLPDNFGRHGRLRRVDEMFVSQFRHVYDHLLLDVGHRRLQRRSISGNDGRGMNAVLDEIIATAQQFGCDDDDRRRTVAHFLVLQVGKVDENAGGGMLYLQRFQNGGAVVRYQDVADIVNEHFVEADGSEGGFHNVSHGESRCDVTYSDILSCFTLTVDEQSCACRIGSRHVVVLC
mmetsp:Transcript_30026/g.55249  ORF Transcript_30026/g.55249 Transcript_30026/m.55249 type:complete len:289 (+) Transcript_30026:1028-1894(+)